MDPSTQRNDPFSANDEAFFQAGVEAEREATSERPVVLDSDELPADTASRATARAARRARLLRTVKSTLLALSLLAVVGLARYALRPEIAAVEQPTPLAVRAAATSDAPSIPAEGPPLEVAADIAASYDDDFASDEASTCQTPAVSATTVPAVAEHRAAKPLSHAPARHGAAPAHRRGTEAPVNKAALLRAIRAS